MGEAISEEPTVGNVCALKDARRAPIISAGYKRTVVGVIPEDWEVVRAGDIGRFGSGSGFPVRHQAQPQGDYPFFKVSDMSRDGNDRLLKECVNHVTDHTRQLLGAAVFPPKSIAFAKVGAAVFLERKRILAKPSCLDNNMAAFVLTDGQADIIFAYYLLSSIRLSALASTTALPSLSSVALSRIQLPYPPFPEQRAIATVLSDVDELIGSLETLLAKKRAIKHAAMQQLLTGRKRLPGFEGEWEEVKVITFVRIRDCKVSPVEVSGDTPCVELEHIGQGDGRLVSHGTAARTSSIKYRFKPRDILFGRLRPYLRKWWLADRGGLCSTEIWPLVVNRERAKSGFFYALVQTA